MELEAVMSVSEINGSVLKRASLLLFPVLGVCARATILQGEKLQSQQKKKAQQLRQGCMFAMTRYLSRQKKREVASSPFLPLLSTSLNEMGGLVISARERLGSSTAHKETLHQLALDKHKPSSPRVSALYSATALVRALSSHSALDTPRIDSSSASERPTLDQSILMTPSNATNAIAFAGNARKKHGTNPRHISPARELSIRQIIRHDALLDDIRRITCQPEDLRRQSSSPEVDGRCRHCSVLLEPSRKQIIRTPPEEKEGTEYQRRSESMIQSSRFDLSAEYWTCRRALTCSTGAAMNETVLPAMIPAMACPMAEKRARSAVSGRSGGVAPLYNPCGPSLLIVCIKQGVRLGSWSIVLRWRYVILESTCQLGDTAEDAGDEAFVVSSRLSFLGQLGLTIMVAARQGRGVCCGCCGHDDWWREERSDSSNQNMISVQKID
ncbi:carrier protein YMC2, partial [Aureobasidium melanogenum]